MTYREVLRQVAVGNHGIVTTRQAEEAGVPAVELRKLAARGALDHIARGVYRHHLVPFDQKTDLAAALARVGPDAHLHGETVLAMFDLGYVDPVTVQVVAPRRVRAKLPNTIRVTVRASIEPSEVTIYDGLRATTVFKALTECVPRLMTERLTVAADEALEKKLINPKERKAVYDLARRRDLVLAG